MSSYIEFRELLGQWLESFEWDVLDELKNEKKRVF